MSSELVKFRIVHQKLISFFYSLPWHVTISRYGRDVRLMPDMPDTKGNMPDDATDDGCLEFISFGKCPPFKTPPSDLFRVTNSTSPWCVTSHCQGLVRD